MTANGFPYFQFHIDRWQAGKISAFDLEEQGLFLHLCVLGWVALGAFNICSTTVQRRYRKPAEWVDATVKAFLDVGIIERDCDKYRIKFIDEQVDLLTGKRQQRVDAGNASEAKRAAALLSSVDNTESKEEKRREEKSSTLNERSTTVQRPLKIEINIDSIKTDFEQAWAAYPDKSGKSKALESYRKHRKAGDTQADILAGIARYKVYVAAKRAKGQDLGWRNGQTFFNQANWRDEWSVAALPPVVAQTKQAPQQPVRITYT